MAILTNRYGYTGPYGSGEYKGSTEVVPRSIAGASYSEYRKCFHFGFDDEQGNGWDEITGEWWVWPETQGAVLTVFDESGQMLLICWDEADDLPYILNTTDGPVGSKMVRSWHDKLSLLDLTSYGFCYPFFLLPEDAGELPHYDAEHQESHFVVRPADDEYAPEDSITVSDVMDHFAGEVSAYIAGSAVSTQKISLSASAPAVRNYLPSVFPQRVSGTSVQIGLSFAEGPYRITDVVNYYKVVDRESLQYQAANSAQNSQLEFGNPTLWLSRGDNLLLNRCNGVTLAGAVTAITGPDGKSGSAMRVTSPVALTNAAGGWAIFWAKAGYSATGFSAGGSDATNVIGTWVLYRVDTIAADAVLASGDFFDLRIFSAALSGDYAAYTYDLVNNSGDSYLPIF